MYYLPIRYFARTLKNLDQILGKAQSYATSRSFDVNNFVQARLFPDMLPFVAQVRIACDIAKATAANLAGKQPPKHEDNETTFAEIRARIEKCLAYLDTLGADDFKRTTPEQLVKLPYPEGKGLTADEYLYGRQIPNFYFHIVTAYNLLRHGGVELGKAEYLAGLEFKDL